MAELLAQYYEGVQDYSAEIRAFFPDGQIPVELRRGISGLVANAMAYADEVTLAGTGKGKIAAQTAVNVHLKDEV